MARIFDNEDDFKRLDFSLSEVSSSAQWVRAAMAGRLSQTQTAPPEKVVQQLKSKAAAEQAVPAVEAPPSEAARVRSLPMLEGSYVLLHNGVFHPTGNGHARLCSVTGG